MNDCPRPVICPHCGRRVEPVHYYRSGKTRCQSRQVWTRARRFKLMGLLEQGKSDQEIGKLMGCSAEAINLARKRYGIAPRRLQKLTAREVTRRMGIGCAKTVTHWIEAGFLKGRRVHGFGGRKMWHVSYDDLVSFLADDRTWHLWTIDRITDPRLKRWAEDQRGDVHFLTPGEFGRMFYVEHGAVNDWIHRGWLPARRWGNWWIDSRVAATWSHERGVSDMPSLADRRAEHSAIEGLKRSGRAA